MATVTLSWVGVCAGGCHVTVDVSFNGGSAQRFTYDVDEFRASITQEKREEFILDLLRFVSVGKTRAEVRTALQAGVTVTA